MYIIIYIYIYVYNYICSRRYKPLTIPGSSSSRYIWSSSCKDELLESRFSSGIVLRIVIHTYPDATHGAGIFTYKTGLLLGVNVGVHIPAPWSIWDSWKHHPNVDYWAIGCERHGFHTE